MTYISNAFACPKGTDDMKMVDEKSINHQKRDCATLSVQLLFLIAFPFFVERGSIATDRGMDRVDDGGTEAEGAVDGWFIFEQKAKMRKKMCNIESAKGQLGQVAYKRSNW